MLWLQKALQFGGAAFEECHCEPCVFPKILPCLGPQNLCSLVSDRERGVFKKGQGAVEHRNQKTKGTLFLIEKPLHDTVSELL